MDRGGRPPRNTGPHCRNPPSYPEAHQPKHFLPVVGRVADRAVTSFHVASPLLRFFFLYRRKRGGEKKNRNHPRFRIQHVRRRRDQVETDFLLRIFLSSSFFLGFDAFSMYLFVRHTFHCFSKIDRGRKRRVPGLSSRFMRNIFRINIGFLGLDLFLWKIFFFFFLSNPLLLLLLRCLYIYTVDINLERCSATFLLDNFLLSGKK